MDLTPALVRRLWDMWDVRILVLLSLTLQVILYILGNRRKYISSLWISIIVWSAYLMADWVATVALGKLSETQVDLNSNNANPINALRAIWAPLLLLHLGGPDTITAYSLEDNQLWMRHFMGLSVQSIMAIYVILLSWRNSWLSYLSLLAFMAGIMKYGERTWVLKSASDDGSDIVPFGYIDSKSPIKDTTEDSYVSAIIVAHQLVREFRCYMVNYDTRRYHFPLEGGNKISMDDNTGLWDAIEVEIALMYDLFYTKASSTYTKGGCILRAISLGSTVFVWIGFSCLFFAEEKWHKHYSKDDIAITGVLLVGALALEIYAVTLILSSDWAMLWLIKHNKSNWVIHLRKKFPWFFPTLKRKRWSRMMGQFDLLDLCLKEDKQQGFAKLLGLLGTPGAKFNWQLHKSCVLVPPDLYSIIFDYVCHLNNPEHGIYDDPDQTIINYPKFSTLPLHHRILIVHLVTEMFYHQDQLLESNSNNISQNSANSSSSGFGDDREIRELCRLLSRYMTYLVLACPSALPLTVSEIRLGLLIDDLKSILRNAKDVSEACQRLESSEGRHNDILIMARDIVKDLKEKQVNIWIALKHLWLKLLTYAAIGIQGHANDHLQQLRQGGQLLTLLWFFMPQFEVFDGIDVIKVDQDIRNSLY